MEIVTSPPGYVTKGFLPVSVAAYLELLDWTARQTMPGKRGLTPSDAPPILERLKVSATTWCESRGTTRSGSANACRRKRVCVLCCRRNRSGNPAAVAVSHDDDLTKWDLVVLPRPPSPPMVGFAPVPARESS